MFNFFLLTVFFLYFGIFLKIIVSGFSFVIVLLFTLFFYTVKVLKLKLHKEKTFIWLFLFLNFSFFSTLLSSNILISLKWFFFELIYIGYIYAGISLINDEFRLEKFFKTIALASLIPSFFGIFQFFTGYIPPNPDIDTIDYVGDRLRVGSGIIDTNFFAFMITLSFLLSYHLSKFNKKYLLISFINLIVCVLTFSRTFFIFFGLFIIILLKDLFKNTKNFLFVIIFLLILILLLSFSDINELVVLRLQSGSDITSGLSRIVQLEKGINMLQDNLFFGVGGEAFKYNYNLYDDFNFVSKYIADSAESFGFSYNQLQKILNVNTMHNTLLKVLFEQGIIPYIPFMIFLFLILRFSLQHQITLLIFLACFVFMMFMPLDSFIFFWLYILCIYSYHKINIKK